MSRAWSSYWRASPTDPRGITTVLAVIVLAVVLALVGVTSYALLGGFGNNSAKTSCAPLNSPACGKYENLHDVSLLLPFESVQQNATIPFVASLPSGEQTSQYTFDYGDGHHNATSTTIVHHAYASPGTYIVSLTASVAGLTHDNFHNLVQVSVTPSSASGTASTAPVVQGTLLGNTTVSSTSATSVITANQFVSVSASYTAAPTDPTFAPIPPTIVGPTGSTISNLVTSNTSASAQVTIGQPGAWPVTFVGGATNGAVKVYSNYTWTVFVTAPGTHASLSRTSVHTSPHPGTIIAYEYVPGGAFSEDPAIDYETAGAEAIDNVYQTLIMYNGTDTGPGWQNYVPVLATCVPGSPQCMALYGQTLISSSGTDYTFVISGNASFYDPSTGNHWGVYPSDVVFSVARTLGFSTLPCVSCNNGWILGQALLSHGNGTWSGIHGSYNNTPQNVYNSMIVNGSECPAAATQNDHGCVTFVANGNNKPWPYFLELVADSLGGSIVPCGWFSSPNQAAGIPYWTSGNVTDAGDHPCQMPGAPGYGVSPASTPALGWDRWEQAGSGYFGTYLGHVQFSMVGSGPYYMANYQVAASYTLKSNPNYGQNPHCTWTGCEPAVGKYANTVEVTWETQATPGEYAYQSGSADVASIPSTDLSLLLQLIQQGKVHAETGPTISISFRPFDMNFQLQGAQRFATSPVTAPTDFFSYLGMRAFFSYAYPYQTVQNTFNTVHGIQLGFLSGGAIPQYMANYYPKDIAWPSQDPCTDSANPTCPAYWWAQMGDPSSPYYDKELAACTPSNPCEFPMFGETGNPAGDAVNALYASDILHYSNGAIKADPVDINFGTLVGLSTSSGPAQNPMPFFKLGWAPDYPDPTDYVNPLYLPNATYTNSNDVEQSLETPQFGSPSGNCAQPGAVPKTGIPSAANLYAEAYYAANPVNNTCQGFAYQALQDELGQAAFDSNLTERVALYDTAEKIAFHLYLYVYTGQSNLIPNAAAWVDPSSFNTNVTIGGGGDELWFGLTGNGVQYAGSV